MSTKKRALYATLRFLVMRTCTFTTRGVSILFSFPSKFESVFPSAGWCWCWCWCWCLCWCCYHKLLLSLSDTGPMHGVCFYAGVVLIGVGRSPNAHVPLQKLPMGPTESPSSQRFGPPVIPTRAPTGGAGVHSPHIDFAVHTVAAEGQLSKNQSQ